MYKIQDNDVISKSNGFGRYYNNHTVADLSNSRIKNNWKQLKKRVVDAVIVTTVTLSTLAVLTLTSGCASRQMQPTIEELSKRYAHTVTVTAKSRDVSMAISKAAFEGRLQLAKRLQTTTLVGSRVIRQNVVRDTSGILYVATVTMAIPQQ